MLNSTQVSVFVLGGYFHAKHLKVLLFLLVLGVYLLIVFCNVLLIAVICVSRSLHEPMFLFLCSLFANELLGSSGLFPFLLLQILADVHRVSAPLCFLQVFMVHSYGTAEFFILAVMSYDRLVAVCRPLQYHSVVTWTKGATLTAAAWLAAFLLVVCTTSLSFPLRRCRDFIPKVYCDNFSVVKLACADTTLNNVFGLFVTLLTVGLPLAFTLYSYARILRVCLCGSTQTRHKAVSTCTPHLASLLNFFFGGIFEVVQSRFDMSGVPGVLRVFLSLYFLSCQPLFTPLLYGLNLTRIRTACRASCVGQILL
uniref:G-protein coupled receptors family 1 profile domain-containing protein n=1 Tax=Oryzias latipes TaxID=8090 RepID=A0A3P9HUX1_ORYLA